MAIKGSKTSPRRGNPGPKAYVLDDESLVTLNEQILIVLADYRDHSLSDLRLKAEGIRIEIAKRIIDNLKAVAAS